MRLLGVDSATNTGLCLLAEGVAPRLFHIRIKDTERMGGKAVTRDRGPFLLDFMREFDAVLEREKPDHVVIEAPVLMPFRRVGKSLVKDSMPKVRKLCGIIGIIEALCARRGIPCHEAEPNEVKKMLSGRGDADKESMVRAAQAMGFSPEDDNEADALGVAMCGAQVLMRGEFDKLRRRQGTQAWLMNYSNTKTKVVRKRAAKRNIKGSLI